MPELAVVAEGDHPAGGRWILKAGGTPEDYFTSFESVHPNGQLRERGGFGGRLLEPGTLVHPCMSWTDQGPPTLIGRMDRRVARVRLELAGGKQLEGSPLGADLGLAVTFFVAVLAHGDELDWVVALDESGRQLERQNFSHYRLPRRFREVLS